MLLIRERGILKRNIGMIRRKQMEILVDLKNIIAEIKSSLEELSSLEEMAEER